MSKKISEFSEVNFPKNSYLVPVVDLEEVKISDRNKKITVENLLNAVDINADFIEIQPLDSTESIYNGNTNQGLESVSNESTAYVAIGSDIEIGRLTVWDYSTRTDNYIETKALERTITIGNTIVTGASHSIAIGTDTRNNAGGGITLGNWIKGGQAWGEIIIGTYAYSSSLNSDYGNIVIGDSARTRANSAITIGANSSAEGYAAISLGYGSAARAIESVSIGQNTGTNSYSPYSIYLGSEGAIYGDSTNSIGIGYNGNIKQNCQNSIGIGKGFTISADSPEAIAIGTDTFIDKPGSIVLGNFANCYSTNTISIGNYINTNTSTDRSVVIGYDCSVLASNAIAIGSQALSKEENSIAIGKESIANGQSSIQLGAGVCNSDLTLQFLSNPIANENGIETKTGTGAPSYAARDGSLYVDVSGLKLYFRAAEQWIAAN